MKIKFLATGDSPDSYSFSGDMITAIHNNDSEQFDLSVIEEGDEFQGCEPSIISLPGHQIIRKAERISGELHVTLCQKPPVTKISLQFEELGRKTLTTGIDEFLQDPVSMGDSFETGKFPEVLTVSKIIKHREGNWTESDWMDVADYNPETLYIQEA